MTAQDTLAVIVPAYNAAATIRACLSAIKASTRQPNEIILFSDGSTDETPDIAREMGVRVIVNPGPCLGPAEGRNRASCETSADILVFVDADVEVHPDAIGILETEIEGSQDVAAAFGSYDDAPHCSRLSAKYANLRHHFVHQNAGAEAGTFWAGLGAVRHVAFDAVGRFDASYRRPSIEDIELGVRLKQRGFRIRLNRAAQGKHWKNWRLFELWRTDILKRAIPWSTLIVSGRTGGFHLNLSMRERASSLLAHGLWMSAAAGLVWPVCWWATLCLAIAYVTLNRRFLALLWRRGGVALLTAGLLLHICYHGYAVAAFGYVVARANLSRLAHGIRRRPASPALAATFERKDES